MLHYTSQFANAMADLADVTVVLPNHTDTTLFEHRTKLISVRTATGLIDYLGASLWLPNLMRIVEAIRSSDPTVVHFLTSHPWNGLILPWLRDQFVVCTVHDLRSHLGESIPILRWSDHLLMARASLVLVHGEYWREYLKQRMSRKNITSIPHGNYAFFTRWGDTKHIEEPGLILFFGRIAKYKGVDTLLQAIPEIEKYISDFKIIIAGAGKLPIDNDLHAGTKVEIINQYIPDPMVAELFQRAQVIVLPYRDASQSGIIAIAYAFAKPVVATTVGALPELVSHEVSGLLVPPNNPKALGEAVARLLTNEKLRYELGRNGLFRSQTEMNWNRIAEQCYSNYLNGIRSSSTK